MFRSFLQILVIGSLVSQSALALPFGLRFFGRPKNFVSSASSIPQTEGALQKFREQRIEETRALNVQAFDLKQTLNQLRIQDQPKTPVSSEDFLKVLNQEQVLSSLHFQNSFSEFGEKEQPLLKAIAIALSLEAKSKELNLTARQRSSLVRWIIRFSGEWIAFKMTEKGDQETEVNAQEISQVFAETMNKVLPEEVKNLLEANAQDQKSTLLPLLQRLQRLTTAEIKKLETMFDKGEKEITLNTPERNRQRAETNALYGFGTLGSVFLFGPVGVLFDQLSSTPYIVIAAALASAYPAFKFLHKSNVYSISVEARAKDLTNQQIEVMVKINQAQINLLVHEILQALLDPQFADRELQFNSNP